MSLAFADTEENAVSPPFDTLSSYKRFVGVGLPENQAEAIIQAIQANNVAALRNLPTREEFREANHKQSEEFREAMHKQSEEFREAMHKQSLEIQAVRTELKAEIQAVRTELKLDIKEFKSDLIRWMVGCLTAMTAVFLAAFTYLR